MDAEWNDIKLLVASPTKAKTSASEFVRVRRTSIHPLGSSFEVVDAGTFPSATTIASRRAVHCLLPNLDDKFVASVTWPDGAV